MSVNHAYPYKDRERYGTLDSKHDLAIFSLGPDPVSVPVEEQRTVLAHAGIN
ncbi:MAG: hypothetical protein SOT55_05050 [Candidatus Cryptobacteroides sp.]|nr:hypothetical protein [Candidatus Cryptobacteroides sp.]